MSAQDQPPGLQDELVLFLEHWQAELRQRPSRRLALTSGTLGATNTEPQDLSAPVVAIWTLHDDVLCEIFYAVASLEPAGSMEQVEESVSRGGRYTGRGRYFFGGLGWIRLSHVCQRWRDILLGTGMAHLWGRVLFTFPSNSAFPTLLSRSRNALVHMFVHTPEYRPSAGFPQRVRTVKNNLPRSRSLRIRGGVTRDLLAIFASPLSLLNLRELDIKLEHGGDVALLHAAMVAIPGEGLPLNVAAMGSAQPTGDIDIDGPNVEYASLELSGLSISGMRPGLRFLLPRLRHLEVRIRDLASSDLHWLISLIRASPLLETLTLALILDDHAPDWNYLFAGTPAYLPHLKQVILEECFSIDYAPFMAQICINPPAFISASLGAVTGSERLAEDVPPQTMRFIHDFGGFLCRPSHLALRISVSLSPTHTASGYIVEVRSMPVFDDPVVLDAPYYAGGINLLQDERTVLGSPPDSVHIAFDVLSTPTASQAWFGALSTRIGNKEHIEQLDLRIFEYLPHSWMKAWRHLLLPMTALRSLYVVPLRSGANSWNDIVNLLCPPLLPALHTLLVAFCAECLFSRDAHERLEAWWNPIVEVLVQRHAHGTAVHTLRIVGAWSASDIKELVQDQDTQMIARLTGVVGNVVDERVTRDSFARRRERMGIQIR